MQSGDGSACYAIRRSKCLIEIKQDHQEKAPKLAEEWDLAEMELQEVEVKDKAGA